MTSEDRRRPGTKLWPVTLALAGVLSIISFTPLVIPAGEIDPTLGGVPVTLWTGVTIAFVYIFLTYLVGRVHPEMKNSEPDEDRKADEGAE